MQNENKADDDIVTWDWSMIFFSIFSRAHFAHLNCARFLEAGIQNNKTAIKSVFQCLNEANVYTYTKQFHWNLTTRQTTRHNFGAWSMMVRCQIASNFNSTSLKCSSAAACEFWFPWQFFFHGVLSIFVVHCCHLFFMRCMLNLIKFLEFFLTRKLLAIFTSLLTRPFYVSTRQKKPQQCCTSFLFR